MSHRIPLEIVQVLEFVLPESEVEVQQVQVEVQEEVPLVEALEE